jgi:hypothetical protein
MDAGEGKFREPVSELEKSSGTRFFAKKPVPEPSGKKF